MRRYACTLLVSVFALAACAGAFAQTKPKSDSKSKQEAEFVPLKDGATLEETLAWLNDNLKRYGKFTLHQPLYEAGYRDRTRFMGLDGKGCSVTYRVRHQVLQAGGDFTARPARGDYSRAPNGDITHSPSIWSPGGSSASVMKQTLDLAALDPSLVVAKTPEKWDGGSVVFSAGRGNVAVTYKDWNNKVWKYDGGEFYVSERERVGPIAEALRRAVALCRK